ncbi:FAR1-related sequence 5-like protein, partial [Tanacetum coccineum]
MSFSLDDSSNEKNIISDEGEHTLIAEIDNNGYIVDEDEMEPTNVFDQSMRYSILGKTFENLDGAYDFYNGYGLSKGFGIRCEAMMQVTLSDLGEWVVDKFISEHNHDLNLPSHVLKQRSHNIFHRSHECKGVVTLLSKAGMKPSDITKVVNAFR